MPALVPLRMRHIAVIFSCLFSKCARYLNPRDLTYPAKCVNLSPGLAGSCESEPRLMASPPNSLNLSSMSLSSTGVRPL